MRRASCLIGLARPTPRISDASEVIEKIATRTPGSPLARRLDPSSAYRAQAGHIAAQPLVRESSGHAFNLTQQNIDVQNKNVSTPLFFIKFI